MKHLISTLMMGALLPLSMALTMSCSNSNKASQEVATVDSISPAQQLIQRLNTLSERQLTAFGHEDDPVYGHAWVGDEGRSDVLEIVGEYPAVMGWDMGGIEIGDSLNLDGVSFERMRREAIAQDARGGINAYNWHPRNPVNGNDSWTTADTTIVSQMVHNPEVAAAYRQQLLTLASYFNSLQRADGSKIGIIFRPWHEHTGNWFFWGTPNCSAADYQALWTEMRRVFDEQGVNNVVWAYSPDRVADDAAYMERYPGDEYVDILGADIYHYGGEKGIEGYQRDAKRALSIARAEAQKRGKIAAFTETGLESIPIANWWTEVLLPVVKEEPVAYVVVWRNAHDKPNHFYGPWKGHASEDNFRAFYNDSTTVFVGQMPR
ncbi:MAG: glycoside hydrolase family 26 protein [Bacteroidales bacterium]|nr:glycoside hydrolase family 26 protein [Bacteroidales bacterium]